MLVSNKWTAYDVDASSIVLFRRVASRRVAVAAAVAATIIPSCGIHSQNIQDLKFRIWNIHGLIILIYITVIWSRKWFYNITK